MRRLAHRICQLVDHLGLLASPDKARAVDPVPLHVQVVHGLHRPGDHHVRHHRQLSSLDVALDHHPERGANVNEHSYIVFRFLLLLKILNIVI